MELVRRGLYYLQDGKLTLFPDDSVNKSIIFSVAEDSAGKSGLALMAGCAVMMQTFNAKRLAMPTRSQDPAGGPGTECVGQERAEMA